MFLGVMIYLRKLLHRNDMHCTHYIPCILNPACTVHIIFRVSNTLPYTAHTMFHVSYSQACTVHNHVPCILHSSL